MHSHFARTARSTLDLDVRLDAAQARAVLAALARDLFEKFPETSFDLIQDLFLRALDSGAKCSGSTAPLARDRIGRLEICLDDARRLATAEIAWFFNCPQQLLDVECGGRAHIPGDTASPPAPDAIQIGPIDV